MTQTASRLTVAQEAWGTVPDWVKVLIEQSERKDSSQNKIGKQIGYTGSVVSQVIRKSYAGNMARVEQAVRDVLMPSTITCPTLGDIGSEICHAHRTNARRLAPSGPLTVRMFRACRTCPRFEEHEGGET